ncbi:MAG: response regulator [Deltaproteobacteria bacterium]|nr:MAG: response regulator [Deltaproteobacteria bacterium]
MKKILVVDDEEAIRSLYRMELEEAGFEVKTAESGEKALEIMEGFEPDLVTLDIKMPGMDGLAVLGEIRKRGKDFPVILCSAYGEYKQDFSSWASDAYIVKSSDVEELVRTVRDLLEERE